MSPENLIIVRNVPSVLWGCILCMCVRVNVNIWQFYLDTASHLFLCEGVSFGANITSPRTL